MYLNLGFTQVASKAIKTPLLSFLSTNKIHDSCKALFSTLEFRTISMFDELLSFSQENLEVLSSTRLTLTSHIFDLIVKSRLSHQIHPKKISFNFTENSVMTPSV